MALFSPQGGFGPSLLEDFKESFLAGIFRSFPFQSLDGIVGNEVHLGIYTARLLGEEAGLLE